MFYARRITVDPGIKESDPLVVEIPLEEKWITDIWVGFEDGAAWTVGVRIYYGIKRWIPENEGEWVWGNDIFIPLRTIIKLPAKQESIKVYVISPNAKYQHDIVIYVWTALEEPISIEEGLMKIAKGFGF